MGEKGWSSRQGEGNQGWPFAQGAWAPGALAGERLSVTQRLCRSQWTAEDPRHKITIGTDCADWGYKSLGMPLLGVPPWRYQLKLLFSVLLIMAKWIKGARCLGLCCGGKAGVEPVRGTYWETCLTAWEYSEDQVGHLSNHWSHQRTGASVPAVTVCGDVDVIPFSIFFLAAGSNLILPLSYFTKLLWAKAVFKYCAVHEQSVSTPAF